MVPDIYLDIIQYINYISSLWSTQHLSVKLYNLHNYKIHRYHQNKCPGDVPENHFCIFKLVCYSISLHIPSKAFL